ncbi:hypothetical protein AC578_8352 [Pseudocercospora eumusae]|uniref:Uncharacterized protein n=1 Tax=Pseudocercospora eumusae TaxID=321146 RepID=A0A139HS55_9PEZI|nr:hypothetical protein AC578_8352 [Pseudocercospora eumusae]
MADKAPTPTNYEHRGDMATSGFVPTAPVTQHIINLVPRTKYSVRSSATYKYTEDDTKSNRSEDPHYPHNPYPGNNGGFNFTATKSEHNLITVAEAWRWQLRPIGNPGRGTDAREEEKKSTSTKCFPKGFKQ